MVSELRISSLGSGIDFIVAGVRYGLVILEGLGMLSLVVVLKHPEHRHG